MGKRKDPAPAQDTELSRKNLKKHGIEFQDTILPLDFDNATDDFLPPHVNSIRLALLDFGTPIKTYHKSTLQDECSRYLKRLLPDTQRVYSATEADRIHEIKTQFTLIPPDCVYLRSTYPANLERLEKTSSVMNKASQVKREAGALTEALHNEPDWTLLFRTQVFPRYEVPTRDRTRFENLFDQWRVGEDIPWMDHKSEAVAEIPRLSYPKPDLTYAFPIYTDRDELPLGLSDLECAKNFSREFLMSLRQPDDDGVCIRSALNTGLFRASKGSLATRKLASYHLMCFPWAVVELKKADVDRDETEKCYCQAANSAAVAIRILQSVLTEGYGSTTYDVPPVIAFTCIGPDVKVWLAYFEHREEARPKVEMRCIFATSLKLRWGVMATWDIVDNMHVWALRVLKARISGALSAIHAKRVDRCLEEDKEFGPQMLRRGSTLSATAIRTLKNVMPNKIKRSYVDHDRAQTLSPRKDSQTSNAVYEGSQSRSEPPIGSNVWKSFSRLKANLNPWEKRQLETSHSTGPTMIGKDKGKAKVATVDYARNRSTGIGASDSEHSRSTKAEPDVYDSIETRLDVETEGSTSLPPSEEASENDSGHSQSTASTDRRHALYRELGRNYRIR